MKLPLIKNFDDKKQIGQQSIIFVENIMNSNRQSLINDLRNTPKIKNIKNKMKNEDEKDLGQQ